MTIRKLKKLKQLGVFSDFTWPASLPAFARYNVIYGANGSGKTTLSNLLAGLAVGAVAGHPACAYEVETDAGSVRDGERAPLPIRVFNRDYVANNVHRVSGSARPIFLLGEESQRLAEDIAADEAVRAAGAARIEALNQRSAAAVRRRDKRLTDVAKTIAVHTSGVTTRSYRRPDAERALAALAGPALLEEAELGMLSAELRQQEKPEVLAPQPPRLPVAGGAVDLQGGLSALAAEAAALCARTVVAQVLERLKQHVDLAGWVERGLALHQAHRSSCCEFCEQPLPPARVAALAAHFNEEDGKLKASADALARRLSAAQAGLALRFPDPANLYDELQPAYASSLARLADAQARLHRELDGVRAAVEGKKARTTEPVALTAALDAAELLAAIEAASASIRAHNAKTAAFVARQDAARKRLEAHHLSEIYDETQADNDEIADAAREIRRIEDGDPLVPGTLGMTALTAKIAESRAAISSSHRGCEALNQALWTFLGRRELQFENDESGYVIRRGEDLAENLSEGEKTAIAFVHFVVHLRDRDFDLASGIVVVDDPISSLDAASMYQAFACLRHAVEGARQVFLLTHNFDFLRLLINWVNHVGKDRPYYMIKRRGSALGRAATLDGLDPLLHRHETEYQYLFKVLCTYQDDGTIESAYHVPNIARKVLDTFLMFRVPNAASTYKKLMALSPLFDVNKLTAIYKFTNDQSHITGHGFDPSLVAETQNNVRHLLALIEAVFPEHHRILVESLAVPTPPPTSP